MWFRFASHELVDVPLNEAADPASSDNASIHLSDDDEDEIGTDRKSLDSYALAIENGNK